MNRPQEIAEAEASMATIVMLTNAFEGLASMRIARIKSQVLGAQQFFADLWTIYNQIRVDRLFRFGRHDSQDQSQIIDKELFIAITAEGGFSGDIDQRLIKLMLDDYSPAKQDIIVVGHHGALQLLQAGITYKKYYKLPEKDTQINVRPLVAEIGRYRKAYVYYQQYESLMTQNVKRIELAKAIQDLGSEVSDRDISEKNYIFEPNSFAVVAHMERSMLDITLGQVILDSKLAQYASRFRAMRMANDRSTKSQKELLISYNRARRAQSDERLKEIVNGLKKTRVQA